MCPKWLEDFADDLRYLLGGSEARRLSESWVASGCFILAEALRQWSDGDVTLWSIVDPWVKDKRFEAVHVVARFGDCFVDAEGAWTEEELLKNWERRNGAPNLRPFSRKDAAVYELPSHPSIKKLVRMLEIEFPR